MGGKSPLDLRFRGPLEAKSFVRGRKNDPPGAPGRVFDLKCASCGHVRRCTVYVFHRVRFSILVLMVEQKMSRNGSIIGLLGCFWVRSASFSEPDPSGGVLGPSLAGKRPKTNQNLNLDF